MSFEVPEEKFLTFIIILVLFFLSYIFIMTPAFTNSNVYEPNELLLKNGNTFLKLRCESTDTQFITSVSNIVCFVGIRSQMWNYSSVSAIIQAAYDDGTPIFGCSVKIINITASSPVNLTLCKNDYYNDSIKRPASKLYMTLTSFQGYYTKNWDPLLDTNKFFDRPIEVMSRNEELNIEISRNSLFIATLALLVMAVLEFRKLIKKS